MLGLCAPKFNYYKKVDHLARDCRSQAATANNQRDTRVIHRVVTCFECGVKAHYKKYFPKLKNKNHGNQTGNREACGRAYPLEGGVANHDSNLVRVPFGNETLIIHGDESNNGHESRLNIISCTMTQKYLLKGCYVFLARITKKRAEDKLEEKRLEDVPIIQDFPKVFPKDFSGIPPT
ncbi:hypothetical protein Tco_0062952 [Tanacetum coccineum]